RRPAVRSERTPPWPSRGCARTPAAPRTGETCTSRSSRLSRRAPRNGNRRGARSRLSADTSRRSSGSVHLHVDLDRVFVFGERADHLFVAVEPLDRGGQKLLQPPREERLSLDQVVDTAPEVG